MTNATRLQGLNCNSVIPSNIAEKSLEPSPSPFPFALMCVHLGIHRHPGKPHFPERDCPGVVPNGNHLSESVTVTCLLAGYQAVGKKRHSSGSRNRVHSGYTLDHLLRCDQIFKCVSGFDLHGHRFFFHGCAGADHGSQPIQQTGYPF